MFDRDDKKWVAEGAKVVIINTGGWTSRIVGTSTIAKIGARDITLANGRKFRVSDLSEQGRDKYRGDQIISSKDKRVAQIKAAKKRQESKNEAASAVDQWVRSKDDPNRLDAAIAALVAFRDGPGEE